MLTDITSRDKFQIQDVRVKIVMQVVLQVQMGELMFNANSDSIGLQTERALHWIDARIWCGNGNAYWLEWDHPLEKSRSLNEIVKGLVENNWQRLIKPLSLCIDIGAHSGDTAIPMALFSFDHRANRKSDIVVIEPNPDLTSIIKACLLINSHLGNFYFNEVAVTPVDCQEVELHDHGNTNCNGGVIGNHSDELRARLQSASQHTYKVRGKSLESIIDPYLKVGEAGRPIFIKTDCEGYDKEILRSSRELIQSLRPALFVEWFTLFEDKDNADFLNVFQELEYEILDPVTLKKIDGEHRPFDVWALPKGKVSSYLEG